MSARRCWIFDLDGTLIHSDHDYAALKARLGLPAELAVLEGIAACPEEDRPGLFAAVDAWEVEHLREVRPMDGAADLLDRLVGRGRSVAVLTRNTRETAVRALEAAGLHRRVIAPFVVGRHEAPCKPAPDGVHLLLRRWGALPSDACLVGDFRFDLLAARAAGVEAVWFDPGRTGEWASLADRVVHHLSELEPWPEGELEG